MLAAERCVLLAQDVADRLFGADAVAARGAAPDVRVEPLAIGLSQLAVDVRRDQGIDRPAVGVVTQTLAGFRCCSRS